MRVLLLIPPMTQLNTAYPSTAYLTGFLRSRGVDAQQADPALELFLRLFSSAGVREITQRIRVRKTTPKSRVSPSFSCFLENAAKYEMAIDSVVRFLQGGDPTLAYRIVGRDFLPEGPRFRVLDEGQGSPEEDPLSLAFGSLGIVDRAKYLASLFMDDLADVIREGIDSRFELSRYGEKLAASAPSFDPIEEALRARPTWVDETLDTITKELLEKHRPELLGLSVPFPGNAYGAFRMAKVARSLHPQLKIAMGGGYVNTELRELSDPRVFDYVDYITLDDGERPLLSLIEHLEGKRGKDALCRTLFREGGKVILQHDSTLHDIPHRDSGIPTYDGLPLDRYVSLFEMLNPMHRLWSDGRWNKLTLAHGCYWRKCNFCDVTLDYIGRYDPASASLLVDRIEAMVKETGQRGFHFVDEAAPPALLRGLAEELLRRKVVITWWGNVRFDKTFTPELTRFLAQAGCVAVSGGLEVASDRLLKLMQKGVTVEQVARVTHAFSSAGVLVHAYLMYGFPTQTEQETVDALERVRQLFEAGCIHSAFWHRFSATIHSPIGKNPQKFGIRLLPEPKVTFARNDLPFEDPTGCDHDQMGVGLRKALYNFMHGVGLDLDVRKWFDKPVPKAKVPKALITKALSEA